MEELVNHRVLDIQISSDENYLKFVTDVGDLIYVTEGGCCSETWFSEIINPNDLINQVVLSCEVLNLPEYNMNDGHCRQQEDKFYGVCLKTSAGTVTIVFRNSSNGYYSGSCELLKNGIIHSSTRFKSIGHLYDWSAYEPTNQSYIHTLKLKAFL